MVMIMSTQGQQNKKCIRIDCRVSYSCSKSKQLKKYMLKKDKISYQNKSKSQNITIIIKVKSNK